MSAHFNSFSIHKQNQSWPAFRWLLLMITFGLLSGCSTSGSIGGLTIPEAYREGLKKEVAKDYKGAIAYYDEAIDNFARFPGWLAKGTVKQAMDPNKLTNDMIANPEKIWVPHKVYLHRAQSKKALGDIAGEKADLALYEKQRVEDKEILGKLMDEEASQKAQAVQDAADAKAGAEAATAANAMSCVQKFMGIKNTCSRTIRIHVKSPSGSGGKFCNDGYYKLYPNEELKVSPECLPKVDVTSATYLDH